MHHLIIVHRAYQDAGEKNQSNFSALPPTCKLWRTCRREIAFLDQEELADIVIAPSDQVYFDRDAEEFLVQVLCGLKSPLVGETEVFGQFKQWWSQLPKDDFKSRFDAKIQSVYSIVKKVREESLYGLGSQSYGSYFRKKLNQLKAESKINSQGLKIDFIGSGQLVAEMLPWVQKEHSYRIWARDIKRATEGGRFADANAVDKIDNMTGAQISVLIVAAPIAHHQLECILQNNNGSVHLFDLRSDSMDFKSDMQLASHLNLNDFSQVVEGAKDGIKTQIENAQKQIARWKFEELNKVQIRPFGWDDL